MRVEKLYPNILLQKDPGIIISSTTSLTCPKLVSRFQKSAISYYPIRIYAPSRRKYPQILLFISLQVKNWKHICWRRLIRSRACKCLAIQWVVCAAMAWTLAATVD